MTRTPGVEPPPVGSPTLWQRQLATIFAQELRKTFFSRRALLVYLVAAMPLVPFPLAVLISEEVIDTTHIVQAFGVIFQFMLRFVVFFGCAWMFSNLFRGELLDRSLHYYFLVPVRREVIVAGKYLAAVSGCMLLFCTTTLATYLTMYLGHSIDQVVSDLFTGAGLERLLDYMATTALACIGYGAVFLLLGLFFRNPFVPAVMIWGWEFINFLLPSMLKKVSVIYYLQSLSPIPFDEGPFAIVAEPVSPTVAVLGVCLVSAALLVIASLRVRRMEISYGLD